MQSQSKQENDVFLLLLLWVRLIIPFTWFILCNERKYRFFPGGGFVRVPVAMVVHPIGCEELLASVRCPQKCNERSEL